MLLKLSKRSWSPVSKVFELSKNLAASANVSRAYIERLQRAAVEAKILEETGKRSRLGAPIYIINLSVIEEFRAKANTTEDEVEQKMRALARRTKVDPEDAAEEATMFVAEDLACVDNVEPFSTALRFQTKMVTH